METRPRKNCCNSAQLTTRKFLKASHHHISYSRSLILPYLLLSKVTCYVTCALKGKDKIEDGSMGPSSRPGPVLGHFMFRKVFLPKDRLVLYFRYLPSCPCTNCRTLTRWAEARQGEFVFPKTCFNSFNLFIGLRRVTHVTNFLF